MDGVAFEFLGVAVDRDGTRVLDRVDATLADHGITVIVGPSGSGKSTMLRLCNRLEVPTSGSVRYRGRDVTTTDPLQLRREVGMVFQRPVALAGSVGDNLREADPAASPTAVDRALDRVGLAGMAARDARVLSGGESQRMCLARMLMVEPEFVLFDEPTSSLDHQAAIGIERLAQDLAATGTPSAWVTHDLDQMRRIAHHLVVVIDGRVAQQGDATDVLETPTPVVDMFFSGGPT